MGLEGLLMLFFAMFAATAFHEIGHASMARLVQLPIAQISIGMPEIGLGFRSKRFRCPVAIGPLPFFGYVRLKALEPRQRSLVTAFAFGGPMASLVLGWASLGALFILYQGFSPGFLALGAVLIAAAGVFAFRPTAVLGYAIPAAIATGVGFAGWASASMAFGAVTAPRLGFLPEMLFLTGVVSSMTGVVNLTTFFSKFIRYASDGSIVERQGGKYAGHIRYLNMAAIACLAIVVATAIWVAFS